MSMSNLLRGARLSLIATAIALAAAPAQASHVFFSDVTANGVALDPNPGSPILANLAGNVVFNVRTFGSADTLLLTFNQTGGTNTLALNIQSVPIPATSLPTGPAPYSSGGTLSTFTLALNGTFTGTLYARTAGSSPDYIAPGQTRGSANQTGHTFTFSVRQPDPVAVPEPASLAVVCVGALAGLGYAYRRRASAA